MTREELIAALEAATEGAWELDAQIADVLNLRLPAGIPSWEWPPRYTASLDAALTLVPDIEAPMSPAGRWPATVDIRRQDNGTGWVSIRATDATPDEADDELCVEAGGATPAIALCIAALKARAT